MPWKRAARSGRLAIVAEWLAERGREERRRQSG